MPHDHQPNEDMFWSVLAGCYISKERATDGAADDDSSLEAEYRHPDDDPDDVGPAGHVLMYVREGNLGRDTITCKKKS